MIEKIGQGLKYPPLKSNINKKLPEYLFWEHKNCFDTTDICMFSTKDSSKYGKMTCIETTPPEKEIKKPYIYVLTLETNSKRQGLGTKMLDYVQNFSKRNGCEGRFYLNADARFAPKEAPHIFYRKYGMNTGIPEKDKKLDMFIKEGKNGTLKEFPYTRMYYPPIPPLENTNPKQENKSFFKILKDLF